MTRVALWFLPWLGLFAASNLALAAEPEPVATPEQVEYFEKKVRPLLVQHCSECHGAKKQKGGLRVDSRAALLQGGDTGPAVVPGKVDEGYLVDAIHYGDTYKMPPRGKLPPEAIATLTEWVRSGAPWPAEAAKPAKVGGAKDFDFEGRRQHWSLQPVAEVAQPKVKNESWVVAPVDRFILQRLESAGLQPNPPADKTTLLRRAAFDLTGLPPTIEQIEVFLADDTANAWSKAVDRLLDSPHYGERWARHWLDLVRYAETCGHEFDFELPEAFEYRDYVIRALNDDLPFDQFVTEHIAGDLLATPRRHPVDRYNESIIATGFYFLGEGKHSPVDIRADECERMDNQIDVIGKAFCAMTVSCARCHDHKFDAIRAKDYYALAGFLQSSRFQRAYADDPSERSKLVAQLNELRGELSAMVAAKSQASGRAVVSSVGDKHDSSKQLIADFGGNNFGEWFVTGEAFGSGPTTSPTMSISAKNNVVFVATTPAGVAHSGLISKKLRGTLRSPTFKITEPTISYRMAGEAGAKVNLIIDGFQLIRNPIYGGLTQSPKGSGDFTWYRQNVSKWVGHYAYLEIIDDDDGWIAVDTITYGDPPAKAPGDSVMTSQTIESTPPLRDWLARVQAVEGKLRYERRVMAMADGSPEDEYVLIRGNHKTLGEQVPRRFFEAVADPKSFTNRETGSGRLELARQMVDPRNPLTARVIVNRLWKHHFGVGIVPTVDDFGHMGQPPTHPEMLDFLAAELVRKRWSLKAMHRAMMVSNVYRMSSAMQPQAATIDPQNKLLHRANVRRLEAEAIRDSLLAVSGSLNDKHFGRSVLPHLTPFMDGRGRPGSSGPLDGEGRRSIYVSVRRNFLTPLFLAFDYPVPFTTIGRRTVSNVPAQALAMMNNPLVLEQSKKWSQRVLADTRHDDRAKIERMYLTSLGRKPTAAELSAAEAFVAAQIEEYGDRAQAWADLAHVMFNLKEFIFVP